MLICLASIEVSASSYGQYSAAFECPNCGTMNYIVRYTRTKKRTNERFPCVHKANGEDEYYVYEEREIGNCTSCGYSKNTLVNVDHVLYRCYGY